MEWIYADLPDSQIKNIQNSVFNEEWRILGYELELNPHITIVPGYRSEKSIDTPNLNGVDVGVNGFSFFPDESNPMVVMLDVSSSSRLQNLRSTLVDEIGESNVDYGLHPFHVTLFKAGDSGDESEFSVSEDVAENIVNSCKEASFPRKVTIKDIVVADWDD